jgi:hypothetical protein
MLATLRSAAVRVRAGVHEEAAERGVRAPALVDAVLVLPFVGSVVVIAAWADRPLFHLLTDDDRILEWLQFAGYATATVLGASIALWLWRARQRVLGGLYVAFTAGCLFITGEEVSWGQRIFDWDTPARLERLNHQGETTVHNIGAVMGFTNGAMLLIGAVGAVAPWLAYHWRDRLRLPRETVRLLVPPLFLTTAFLILFAYKAVRFTLFQDPQSATVSFGEWPELCLAYALGAFALLNRLALRAPATEEVVRAPATDEAVLAPVTEEESVPAIARLEADPDQLALRP